MYPGSIREHRRIDCGHPLVLRPWYDLRCKDGSILFAMAETGTMWKADIEEKLAWVDQLTSAETAKAMPNYVGGAGFPVRMGSCVYPRADVSIA